MSARDLIVLGSASAVPTKNRNHNGYLLRWDGHGLLFDPGEGTQRQMTWAGVSASDVTWICVTHFHGDFGHRTLFDAAAPVLPGLEPVAQFVF